MKLVIQPGMILAIHEEGDEPDFYRVDSIEPEVENDDVVIYLVGESTSRNLRITRMAEE